MFSEVKAEIIELLGNLAFTRNLSLTLLLAIACLLSLAQLESQGTQTAQKASITNISRPSATRFIVEN